MNDPISIITTIFDKSKSIVFKIGVGLSYLSALLVIDSIFHISYRAYFDYKYESLVSLNELSKSFSNDSLIQNDINNEIRRLSNKKYFKDYLFDPLNNSPNSLNISAPAPQNSLIARNNIIMNNSSILNIYLMTISSSFFFIVLIILILISPLTNNIIGYSEFWKERLMFMVVLLFCMVLSLVAAYKIPPINNHPYINYIINFTLHSIICFIFALLVNISGRKTDD